MGGATGNLSSEIGWLPIERNRLATFLAKTLGSLSAKTLATYSAKAEKLVHLRSRRWLVEEVTPSPTPGQSPVVKLACADDDAQGHSLEVFWDYEIDRRIIAEEVWANLATKSFGPPRHFAAFLHTLRWNCVTATVPNLFQSPFRAGIKLDAYQMEQLRRA